MVNAFMVLFKGSITIEKSRRKHLYRWKGSQKISEYSLNARRAVLRITGADAVNKFSNFDKNFFVSIDFFEKGGRFVVKLKRSCQGKKLQSYFSSHPYLQVVLNKELPKYFWKDFELKGKKSWTFSINVDFDLDEWKDLNLKSWDFLPLVERDAKDLMKVALQAGFVVKFIPKGRFYDLELSTGKATFILGISSHVAKNQSRSKEKRKQKILQDIAKMLLEIHKREVIPVILSRPIEFEGSWSYSTDSYLKFYENEFNFHFLETNFEKGWERKICKQLLEIYRNSKLYKVN